MNSEVRPHPLVEPDPSRSQAGDDEEDPHPSSAPAVAPTQTDPTAPPRSPQDPYFLGRRPIRRIS
ncbi:hypothetical protein NKG05_24040 [Oerskovia sp. M15]